jgi:hypothetical protein
MGKTKASLLDDVLSKAANKSPGFRPWFERLPPDAQAELNAVRQAFNPAIHQKRSYARAVIAAAKERGWEISGEQGVIRWLDAKH